MSNRATTPQLGGVSGAWWHLEPMCSTRPRVCREYRNSAPPCATNATCRVAENAPPGRPARLGADALHTRHKQDAPQSVGPARPQRTEIIMSAAPSGHRRRADLLQFEFDHGRLSTAALAAGRAVEDVLAAQHRSAGATSWAERVDTSPKGDALGVATADAARRAVAVMARVERIVGPVDAILIRRLLGEGYDFAGAAALNGRSGARAVSYVAQRFRDALEELAEASRSIGSTAPHISDKYAVAAEAARSRNA